jgi:hypothetical protein
MHVALIRCIWKHFDILYKNITSNISIHLVVSYLLENTLNNVHLIVLKLVAWKYCMVIGLCVPIKKFGQRMWYYFYVIWYLTTICVHGLNLVQFGISILVLLIPISCYRCCDQGLNWFSRNLKDIKLCTNFYYFNYHFVY